MRISLVSSWLLVCLIALPALCMTQNASGQDDLRLKLKEMEEIIRNQQEQIHSIRSSIKSIEAIEAPKIGENDFKAYWDKGLRFESGNGNFKLKMGGRIMNDWGWFSENSAVKKVIGDQVDGTEFRRVRLYMGGDIYENVGYKIEFDYEGGEANFKDVYIELKKIPYMGHFRVGHYKEPFSLEELTSSRFITFMERSLNNVFAPSRNTGFMLHNHALDERMTWATGLFRNADDFGNDNDQDRSNEGNYSFSGRLTGLPVYEDEGRKMAHVGFGYTYQNAKDDSLRFGQRPEMHMTDRFVDTGAFDAEHSNIFNPELAIVYGPFSFQEK